MERGRKYLYGCPFCRAVVNSEWQLNEHIFKNHPSTITNGNIKIPKKTKRILKKYKKLKKIINSIPMDEEFHTTTSSNKHKTFPWCKIKKMKKIINKI